MMLNLIKAINCMKTFDIQEINSVREIDTYLKYSKTYEKDLKLPKNNLHKCKTDEPKINAKSDNEAYCKKLNHSSIEEEDHHEIESMYNLKEEDTLENIMLNFAKQAEMMKMASQGDENLLSTFKKMIMDDPKRNIFSKSERLNYLVNQPNAEGNTLLYQACLNGHLSYVKLLLDCDADHLLKVGKRKEEQLSILDAAVRWNHSKLVSYLIETNEYHLEWPKEYLTSSIQIAIKQGNKNLVKILRKSLAKKKSTGCFFSCFS